MKPPPDIAAASRSDVIMGAVFSTVLEAASWAVVIVAKPSPWFQPSDTNSHVAAFVLTALIVLCAAVAIRLMNRTASGWIGVAMILLWFVRVGYMAWFAGVLLHWVLTIASFQFATLVIIPAALFDLRGAPAAEAKHAGRPRDERSPSR